jgi:outer membrane protein insertion porin family
MFARVRIFIVFVVMFNQIFPEVSEDFIRSIKLKGNESISHEKILTLVRQKPPNFLFRKPIFDSRLLKLDALTLKSFYHSKGFLDIKIQESFERENNNIDINYIIDEGKRYYLSEVEVVGNYKISNNKINDFLGLKIQEPYNPVFINDNLYLLENEYHQVGKLFAEILIKDEISDSVKVKVVINEKEDIFIKNTFLENIGKIDSSQIFREITYLEGQKYSKKEIDKSLRRLREMGIFSMVNIIPVKVSNSENLVNLVIELNHYKQREWNSVGGYDPIQFSEGAEPLPALSINTEWRNRSFFNSPTQFSTELLAGVPVEEEFIAPRIRYDINLSSNWFFGIRFPTKITGYYETFFTKDEQNNSVIPVNTIERRGINLSQHVNFFNRSYFETRSILESFSDASENDGSIEQRAISLKVNLDKKDDPIFTKRGYLVSGILKYAGFGGERNYLKLDLNIQSYLPFRNQSVIAFRCKVGKIFGWDNEGSDYSYEKFYLGGSTSMRGWDVLRFKTKKIDDHPLGATNRVMTNLEYRGPLYKSFGITLFIDGGALEEDSKNISLINTKWDSGIGLTIQTPLGPARIDYAFQIENPQIWKIQLGVQNLF